jgi:putative transcriptional regulator
MPQMMDPNFSQTVSILSEFNESGAVALIINRPLQITLRDVLAADFRKQLELDANVAAILKKQFVYWGGPVDIQQGLILHNSAELADSSVEISNNLYITGSIHVLKDLLKRKADGDTECFFRFFLGYSGWESHQLEREMSESCWITSKIESFVFELPADEIWKKVVKSLGVELSQLTSVNQEKFH